MVLSKFANEKALQIERRVFAGTLIFTVILYVGLTLWLNAIRANAAIWFVWALIIVQILLYTGIFVQSYQRFIDCGFKRFGIFPFIVLGVLGRVENWELFIIPLVVIIMLIISAKNKNQHFI